MMVRACGENLTVFHGVMPMRVCTSWPSALVTGERCTSSCVGVPLVMLVMAGRWGVQLFFQFYAWHVPHRPVIARRIAPVAKV
jgi:hypothetical protein